MLVEIQSVHFAFRRDAQEAHGVDSQHHHHGDGEGRNRNECAADQLRFQDGRTAAVKQPGQRSGDGAFVSAVVGP